MRKLLKESGSGEDSVEGQALDAAALGDEDLGFASKVVAERTQERLRTLFAKSD